MFTKSLLGYDSVSSPQTEAERGGQSIPLRHSRTPSYVVIYGQLSVRWPIDTWAVLNVTS